MQKEIDHELKMILNRIQYDIEYIKNHMSSYLGKGIAVTSLINETPIYINSNDYGCPSNFINGGRYEEENFSILASFRKPDSIFLDIGANLGVFSLRMAPLVKNGKVFAFEPNPKIRNLFTQSVHLNGMSDTISIFEVGASDCDKTVFLSIENSHAGGAAVTENYVPNDVKLSQLTIEVRRLDGVLSEIPRFDIAKIDVEGHELSVLNGMTNLLKRSPQSIVLFEKLDMNSGIEKELSNFFSSHGKNVYRVDGDSLVEISLSEFCDSSSYFLAAHPDMVSKQFKRNILFVYSEDLLSAHGVINKKSYFCNTVSDSLIFHGPYWYLQRGTYDIYIEGEFTSDFTLTISEKFGCKIADFQVSNSNRDFNLIVDRDLTKFEFVARSNKNIEIQIKFIRLTRLG